MSWIKDTGHCYSMMTFTFLASTAFEAFSLAFGLNDPKKWKKLESNYASPGLYAAVRGSIPGTSGFLNFIKASDPKITADNKQNIEAIFKKQDFSLIRLAQVVRHAVAHGRATPGGWKSKSEDVAKLCKLLGDFHVKVMYEDYEARFAKRVKNVQR